MTDLPAVVGAYADRMHRAVGPQHHVASPLGAWLLVALAASATADDRLETALGCPPADAHIAARELLANPHPVLRLAAAAWHSVDSDALQSWLDSLGDDVEIAPVPSQAQADAWAREHTDGLIEQFPLPIDLRTKLVLASAVACAISWRAQFHAAEASELRLARAAGFDSVRRVLRTPERVARQLIADSAVGPLAVQAMPSTDEDMLVVSVIAASSADAADVLAHAHGIASRMARNEPLPGQRSLFDLPLGTGHSWTLTEESAIGTHDEERFASYLPAWSAESEHQLLGMPGLGFAAAGDALIALLPPDDYSVGAKQVALARYTRTGFQAAAVTGMAMVSSAMMRQSEVKLRTATLEFTHPYAVAAVACGNGLWAGLPLFSAWVTDADEVAEG